MRDAGDVSLEEDYGADLVGMNEGFDVWACLVAVETDDEELMSVSNSVSRKFYLPTVKWLLRLKQQA